MTYYDPPDNDTPDVLDTPAVEEVSLDTPDAPEEGQPEAAPEVEDAPAEETPPPAPDLTQTVQQLAQTMLADQQRRQQEAEQQRQADLLRQQEASRPKPLMEQEAWRARYEEAASRASYDPEAVRALIGMNQELARETAQQMMADQMGTMRLEMQADALVQQAARESLTPYGGLVRDSDFQAVAYEIFGNNRAALAQALSPQNPKAAQLRQTLADAAAGRALREGRVQQGRANPAPPANPRSAARPAPAARPPVNEVTDPDVEIASLYYSRRN